MSANKQEYRLLCDSENSVPIFLRSWWLDATCGPDAWDVSLVKNDGIIQAALPFYKKKLGPYTILTQPRLTPFLGPWLRHLAGKSSSTMSREKELMTALISTLPTHDSYLQNWAPSVGNWLPFYWQGFQQTTNYTYVLSSSCNGSDLIWDGLRQNIRSDVRKAELKFKLEVDSDSLLDDFLPLNRQIFERQKRQPSYSEALVRSIDDACVKRQCRKIFIARDARGVPHSGAYCIFSENSAYYLMGGSDNALRNSGAGSLCLWTAIKYSHALGKTFDFEGSMSEPIERFFRSFGATQTPYMRVSRTTSLSLKALATMRRLFP